MCTHRNHNASAFALSQSQIAQPAATAQPPTLSEQSMGRRRFLTRVIGATILAGSAGLFAALPIQAQTAATLGQADWRFCTKCDALFFDGSADKGKCVNGGFHQAAGFNFVLPHDDAQANGQRDWRFCNKCGGMFFNGYSRKGNCPAGGGHAAAGYNFVLDYQRDLRNLPTKLEFDSKPIGFRNGVPVGGWSHVTLYSDGRYHFTGHFHVSGAPSYNVGLAWVIRAAAGQAFLFPKKGHLNGTFESGSRDCDWDMSGFNEDIKRNWVELALGSHAEYKAEVNVDISALVSSAKQAVEGVGEIVKVVQVIAP